MFKISKPWEEKEVVDAIWAELQKEGHMDVKIMSDEPIKTSGQLENAIRFLCQPTDQTRVVVMQRDGDLPPLCTISWQRP